MDASLLSGDGNGGGGDGGGGGGGGAAYSSSRSLKNLGQIVHPTMSAEDALTLTPWEKFRLHRRMPWKLTLHLIILGLCWSQTQQYTMQVVPCQFASSLPLLVIFNQAPDIDNTLT